MAGKACQSSEDSEVDLHELDIRVWNQVTETLPVVPRNVLNN